MALLRAKIGQATIIPSTFPSNISREKKTQEETNSFHVDGVGLL